MPEKSRAYRHTFFDSERWAAFETRPGDVIVCTSYKAGTTWTQMICALLIHQTPHLPAPLAELSPWLDLRLASMESINAIYGAQDFRRVIKTHTPLDGLNYQAGVDYVICAREPRDVFMSLQNHLANGDLARIDALLAAQGIEIPKRPPLPEDLNDRFKLWMTRSAFAWEEDGLPYWSHFRHAETFWRYRHLPNVHFLHFSDLKADLEGEMRRLAGALDLAPPEDAWPALVNAATFEDMKANADRTAPDTNHGIWVDNSRFFNKGENRQWAGALSAESLSLYEEATRERYPADLLAWLEEGALKAGRP